MALPFIITSLAAAFGYAIAALLVKRCINAGVGAFRMTFYCNWVMAFCSLTYCQWGVDTDFFWSLELIVKAALIGTTFFLGQVFTFVALGRGEVSVATPVLGLKVILVAVIGLVFFAEPIPAHWWFAAGLAAAATFLISGVRGKIHLRGSGRHAVVWGIISASWFALTDRLIQEWTAELPAGPVALLAFFSTALLSFLLYPWFHGPILTIPIAVRGWVALAALALGVQATLMFVSIAGSGSATAVNVLYSSRGLWSVILVWVAGSWFANTEGQQGTKVLVYRLIGSLLVVLAIILVISGG
ncbi:MAG: EamA family transporter [Verrucomicrobiales bacterium]